MTRFYAAIAVSALIIITAPGLPFAQETSETDISEFTVLDGSARSLTIAQIDEMAKSLRAQVKDGACSSAMTGILELQDAANRAANLIKQGVEPFYRASRDNRDTIQRSSVKRFQTLVEAETLSNRMLQVRNEFWVIEAECLLSEGQEEAAINRFYRALRFIDGVNEAKLWERARNAVWTHVGFKPE